MRVLARSSFLNEPPVVRSFLRPRPSQTRRRERSGRVRLGSAARRRFLSLQTPPLPPYAPPWSWAAPSSSAPLVPPLTALFANAGGRRLRSSPHTPPGTSTRRHPTPALSRPSFPSLHPPFALLVDFMSPLVPLRPAGVIPVAACGWRRMMRWRGRSGRRRFRGWWGRRGEQPDGEHDKDPAGDEEVERINLRMTVHVVAHRRCLRGLLSCV